MVKAGLACAWGNLASFSALQREAVGGDNDADNGDRGSREPVVSLRLVLQASFASCVPQITEPWGDERQIYIVDRQPLIRYIYSVSTGVGQLGCSVLYLWSQKLDSPRLPKPP